MTTARIERQECDHGTHAACRASSFLHDVAEVACRQWRNRLAQQFSHPMRTRMVK
jgi:hypothetical protein